MKKQKTDILNEGDSFTMTVGGKGFAIKEFLVRYMSKLELGRKDVFFPGSFQKKSRDVSVTYAVAYHGLEDLKERLGCDEDKGGRCDLGRWKDHFVHEETEDGHPE